MTRTHSEAPEHTQHAFPVLAPRTIELPDGTEYTLPVPADMQPGTPVTEKIARIAYAHALNGFRAICSKDVSERGKSYDADALAAKWSSYIEHLGVPREATGGATARELAALRFLRSEPLALTIEHGGVAYAAQTVLPGGLGAKFPTSPRKPRNATEAEEAAHSLKREEYEAFCDRIVERALESTKDTTVLGIAVHLAAIRAERKAAAEARKNTNGAAAVAATADNAEALEI